MLLELLKNKILTPEQYIEALDKVFAVPDKPSPTQLPVPKKKVVAPKKNVVAPKKNVAPKKKVVATKKNVVAPKKRTVKSKPLPPISSSAKNNRQALVNKHSTWLAEKEEEVKASHKLISKQLPVLREIILSVKTKVQLAERDSEGLFKKTWWVTDERQIQIYRPKLTLLLEIGQSSKIKYLNNMRLTVLR